MELELSNPTFNGNITGVNQSSVDPDFIDNIDENIEDLSNYNVLILHPGDEDSCTTGSVRNYNEIALGVFTSPVNTEVSIFRLFDFIWFSCFYVSIYFFSIYLFFHLFFYLDQLADHHIGGYVSYNTHRRRC